MPWEISYRETIIYNLSNILVAGGCMAGCCCSPATVRDLCRSDGGLLLQTHTSWETVFPSN